MPVEQFGPIPPRYVHIGHFETDTNDRYVPAHRLSPFCEVISPPYLCSARLILQQLRLLFTTDPEAKFPLIEEMLFPSDWLDSLAENDPHGRTNREVQREVCFRVSER